MVADKKVDCVWDGLVRLQPDITDFGAFLTNTFDRECMREQSV